MNIMAWYVCFAPSKTKPLSHMFGHVKVFGYTTDDTWFFYDPTRNGGDLDITHHYDTVETYMALMMEGNLVLKLTETRHMRFHIMPIQNCATIVGHMLGYRALGPWHLKRKLLRNGAEVFYDGTTQGKCGIEGSPRA